MPKPRQVKPGGPATFYAVSPWHDKPNKADDAATEAVVVEQQLVVGGGGGGGAALPAAAAEEQQMAVDAGAAGASAAEMPAVGTAAGAAAAASPPVQQQTASAAPSVAAAAGGGSVSKKRKPLEEEGAAQLVAESAADGGSCPLVSASERSDGMDEEGQGAATAGAVVLEGTAYLALLPNGSVTGHLVCAPSALSGGGRRRSLGLMGEVLVAGRECTRDADWGVMRVTLINFAATAASSAAASAAGTPLSAAAGGGSSAGGGAGGGEGDEGGSGAGQAPRGEVSLLCERTEGDAMRLRAPVPWQGLELEGLPALDATCSCPTASGLALGFACEQLLEGPAGEALLRRMQRSLAGKGAVVNVGPMRVELPAEAAADLLLLGAGPGTGPARAGDGGGQQLQRGTPSPAPPQRQQQQQQSQGQQGQEQQERMCGRRSGGGAGRVVQDSGDDW